MTNVNKRFKGYQSSLTNGKITQRVSTNRPHDGKVISIDFLSFRGPFPNSVWLLTATSGRPFSHHWIWIALKKEARPLTFLNMTAIIDTLSISMAYCVKVNSIVSMWIVTLVCPDLFSQGQMVYSEFSSQTEDKQLSCNNITGLTLN